MSNVRVGTKCSSVTPCKQIILRKIFNAQFRVVYSVQRKHKYVNSVAVCIDLNSGPGMYEYGGKLIKGSPIIALEESRMSTSKQCDFFPECRRLAADFYFIDKSQSTISALMENVRKIGIKTEDETRISYLQMDHKKYAEQLTRDSFRINTYGYVYHDPYGFPSFNLLEQICNFEWARRLDIIVRVPTVTVKRCSKACPNKYKTLKQHIGTICKKYWAISEIDKGDKNTQWVFLVGTNWDKHFILRETVGFHDITSPSGRQIFDKANYTKGELGVAA